MTARRPLLVAGALLCAATPTVLPAAPAAAATTVSADGAGYGHGVGMSQYGALGFARRGVGYRQILAHYYRGTQVGRLDRPSEVRVLLQGGWRTVRFDGAVRVAGDRRLRPSTTYRVTAAPGGQVALRSPRGRVIARYLAPLRVEAPQGGAVRLLGRAGNGVWSGTYRGALELRPGASGGVNAINAVDLEDYVRGVVSGESPASWPAEALRAQAVAARTYAIATSKPGTGFDHYADVRSQVYNGVAGERPTTDAAVRDTGSEVVVYDGRPVVTYFFSTSGGHTEDVENSFLGARPQPWLRGVPDPYDDASPRHRWSLRWALARVDARLGGWVRGRLLGVEVLRRGASQRVVAADVVGTRGRTRVTGPQLRARLGLPDTWVTFTTLQTDVVPPRPAAEGVAGGAVPGLGVSTSDGLATVRGRVFPASAGGSLVLERREGASWRREADVRPADDGRYEVAVTRPGTFRIRAGRALGPAVTVRP
jgi:stage II sporulation protein D